MGCYPFSIFREKSWKIGGRKGKLFSICAYYHNLLVKVGVLYLLCSVCSYLFHAYAIGIVICMLVCMLGMLGRIETMFLKCFPFMFCLISKFSCMGVLALLTLG